MYYSNIKFFVIWISGKSHRILIFDNWPKKATKSKYKVKVGKTTKVKAKLTLVNRKKKHIDEDHAAKLRYQTSNNNVATVNKKGKIKGINKGTCTIYIYDINGKMTKVKVTVK